MSVCAIVQSRRVSAWSTASSTRILRPSAARECASSIVAVRARAEAPRPASAVCRGRSKLAGFVRLCDVMPSHRVRCATPVYRFLTLPQRFLVSVSHGSVIGGKTSLKGYSFRNKITLFWLICTIYNIGVGTGGQGAHVPSTDIGGVQVMYLYSLKTEEGVGKMVSLACSIYKLRGSIHSIAPRRVLSGSHPMSFHSLRSLG